MSYEILGLYLVSAANGFLSYVIVRGRTKIINIIFSLFALSAALWAFFLAQFIYTSNLSNALIYANLYYFFAAAIPVLLFYFSLYFGSSLKIEKAGNMYLIFLVPWLLINVFFVLDKNIIIESVFWLEEEKNVVLNITSYIFYTIFFLFYFISTYILLFKKYQSTKERDFKSQLKLIIGGTLLSYLFGMIFNLFLPLTGNYSLIWVGPLFSVFMISSVGYAIVKYQLFDIRVIATQLFIFLLSGSLFIRFLFSNTKEDLIFNSILLLATIVLGYFLIRSVNKEVEAREHIEELAKDLKIANAKLHRVNMLKTEFVSVATHQLRSPLTAIKGYTSMILEESYGKVPEKLKEPIERIFRSTESLTQVVQDFLDVSRIEQGSMNYNFAAFDFKDLVTEVVEDQKPNIEKSGLEVTFEKEDSPKEKNYILRGDRLKFKQVITNLIDNAIKYTKEGFIRISLTNKDGKIRLEVEDSGMGINEKTLKTLFQKFHRADNADEVNVQGTGLGLYIAKQIVETHNGRIWAESDGPGEGSTFIIELDNK